MKGEGLWDGTSVWLKANLVVLSLSSQYNLQWMMTHDEGADHKTIVLEMQMDKTWILPGWFVVGISLRHKKQPNYEGFIGHDKLSNNGLVGFMVLYSLVQHCSHLKNIFNIEICIFFCPCLT